VASVRAIAKEVGVSAATVSRAMNNHPMVAADVRDRVLEVANRFGYVATVGRRTTNYIALCYMGERTIGSPFDAALMQGISDRLDAAGYDLVILDANRARQNGESLSQMLHRRGVRGAILRTTTRSRSLAEQLSSEGFPCVVVGDRFSEQSGVISIYSDSSETSREAVEHLLALGHKHVAMLLNVVDDSDHLDRLSGYRQALEKQSIDFDDRMVFRAAASLDAGVQFVRKLATASPRPTAVYVADPMAAVGVINEARRTGLRVPEDLSVVGFDDGQLRHLTYPTMTSVVQDAEELGRGAFDLLTARLDKVTSSNSNGKTGEKLPMIGITRVLATHLEIHETTAPPAQNA